MTLKAPPLVAVPLPVIPCQQEGMQSLFDADPGVEWHNRADSTTHWARIREAIALCRGCPNLQPCQQFAHAHPDVCGVIAGVHRPWPTSRSNPGQRHNRGAA